MDLFRADFDDFNGEGILPDANDDPIQFMTTVLNADEAGKSLFCYDEVSCNIGYRRKYTPIIHEVVPN